ncbi:YdeI/OmpD-associated family protein [Umezawaea beigongshangensis]|uniref:YdeI/OmpD-associated family protein n=1 Tax=Umezawaea beigongshangensis TaxID=2780383 RepID=UPI0018F175AB|nr:YdeI/OmpD-associated family protein [Umezawaea beigongshangensis]
MEPTFFATPDEFRAWLEQHHATESELHVGFYKKGSGRPSTTWAESVDQALCFGWIDGVTRRLDDESYTIRFTPRRPRSHWSNVNIARMGELIERGLARPAGIAAFEARTAERSGQASFEQETVEFAAEHRAEFEAHADAWAWFCAQPPGYRKTATWWVISAKREETRRTRLATLIRDSADGLKIASQRRS